MKEFTDLLAGVVGLLWVALAAYIVYRFGPGIDRILKSVRKGKFFGQEFELDEALNDLEKQAQESASEMQDAPTVRELGSVATDEVPEANHSRVYPDVEKILDDAKENPKVALLLLANSIEKELREIYFSQGQIGKPKKFSWNFAISELTNSGRLTNTQAHALRTFTRVRNSMVHDIVNVSESDVLRAIDSGLTILFTIREISRGRFFIRHAEIPIYSDPDCTDKKSGIVGVMINARTATDELTVGVYPTTRTYEAGQQVAWEWKGGTIWNAGYYVDPETSEKMTAWSESYEFVGRPLQNIG